MSQVINYSSRGGNGSGSGVKTYPTLSSFPLVGNTNGDVALALDTDTLYSWNGSSWVAIASPDAANAITALTSDVSASGPGSAAATVNSVGGKTAAQIATVVTNTSGVNTGDQTITLTSDVSGSGTGSFATTVNSVGGSSAANIHSAELAANAATDANTPSTIVKRDGSGNTTLNNALVAGVDSPSAAGTISIGATNATTINIGNPSATVNIQGTVTQLEATNTDVKDQLITLNHGGSAGSASGTGIEFEENNVITGYVKTSSDRNGLDIKAPNTAGVATITPGASGIVLNQSSHDPVTLTAVGSTPNANGASISGQALTLQPADATHPGVVTALAQTFAGVKTFSNDILGSATLQLGGAAALLLDGVSSAFPASPTFDAFACILRTNGGGSAPFDQAGSLIYRPRLSSTSGRSSHLFYTGATPTLRLKIDETGLATFSNGITVTGTTTLNTALGIASGGTGVSSVTTSPAATAFAGWDANKNLSANSLIEGYATTATAAGTTTLTVSSAFQQFFTGTTTQTVALPVVSTLVTGQSFMIVNLSTGNVTVQSSGGNTLQVMLPNTQMLVTCISTSGTGIASWNATYHSTTITAPVNPTIQKFTSGSGTYTTPAGVQFIRVRMVGGGGGGGGSGTAAGTAATSGGNTTFGSSLLAANGGAFGGNGNIQAGGAGGSASLGTGPIGTAVTGMAGAASFGSTSTTGDAGGIGGVTPFGGAGVPTASTGGAAVANSGGGGGGGSGGGVSALVGGGGGGAGGYVDAIITSPSVTYAYAVGAGGNAGGAGTSGNAGGAGGSGYIEVTEYYNNTAISTGVAVAPNLVLAGPASGANNVPTFRSLATGDFVAPTVQKFTSGSGTYTTPTSPRTPLYIRVRMVGGGGGGAGGGTSTVDGTAGGNTTFGSSLLVANGGAKGSGAGGVGGTASLGTGPIGTAISGGSGSSFTSPATNSQGAAGGNSALGGGGGGGSIAGATNTGGGGGGGASSTGSTGGGGGAGGFVDAIITSPAATYAYAVGAGGSGGVGSATTGGAGGSGYIEVTEYYQ